MNYALLADCTERLCAIKCWSSFANFFDGKNLHASTRLDDIFPLKRRRSQWNKFQLNFDLNVPGLGWHPVILWIMIVYSVGARMRDRQPYIHETFCLDTPLPLKRSW
jgi:hypothetical protein